MGGCDRRWLGSVLSAIRRYQERGRAALENLGAELSHLAWSDQAPSAAQFAGTEDRFRRHPVAASVDLGCSALLMYWPPGHATLPHDHGGFWGIEVVLDGALHVEEFIRRGSDSAPELAMSRSVYLGVGDVAHFTSNRYVHRCRNLSNASPTLTLNVYGGRLESYLAFDCGNSGSLTAEPRIAICDSPLS